MKITVKSPRASATSMTAIGLALAAAATPAQAATKIATDTTAALLTSTAGDITITEDGTITVDSGDAITVDTDATVDNDGDIEVGDADGAAGIRVKAGTTATIINSGTITVSEDYVPTDDDANSIPDGAIAAATNRYGIVVEGGSQGSITNSGTITVEGLNSAGIAVLGDYTGSIIQESGGATYVYGDYSTGLLTGNVDGDITVEGVISVTGEGARAMAVEGDVTGSIVIQGTVRQNVTYTTDDSDVLTLSRKDVRVGAAAVEITGNVAGGISVAGPPLDLSSTSTDEDGDGVTDSEEATGTITSYGNGPALLIGGTSDTTIGAVTGNDGTYSLNIEGTVIGTAYYSSTDAYGAVIGGQGGNVTLTDGIGVSGALRATTYDSTATALLINAGSEVNSLYVSGAIIAQITSTGEGASYAVYDLSGTLTSITNTGTISASGSSEDLLHAIDVSSNTTGVTITQYLNAVDTATRADIEEDGDEDTTVYAMIYGDVVTGSGDDTFDVSTGTVTGNTYFNAGDDTLLLSGDAAYKGKVYSGAGMLTMSLSDEATFTGTVDADGQIALVTIADSATYKGTFADAANLTVDVTGGTLRAKAAETVSFGTLNVGAEGTIGVYIDSETGTNSLFDVTSATFADGAKVTAEITQLAGAEGSYTFLTADTLTGLPSFDADATDLPYIFDAGVTQSGNDLVLTITRKSAAALGLTASNASAWDAIFVAADADEDISASLLAITDSDTLNTQVSQLLPDHSGGVFDLVTRGSRLAARHVMDDSSFFKDYETGMWMEPIIWRTSKEAGDTASYSARGWGISTGYEQRTGIGMVGLSYTYTHGKVSDNDGAGALSISQNEVAAFWRTSDGPLYGFARISGAHLGVNSTRTFTGTIDDTDFSYASTGKWNGWLVGAMGGASMNFDVTEDVSLKPMVVADYFRLWENGYTESGGGDAMDLTVLDRNSSVAGATASLTASYRFGPRSNDARPLTVEVEGGYRSVLSSNLGTTSAYFTDGATFSIMPEKLKGGYQSEVRLLAGGWDYTWQLAARADQNTDGSVDYSGRASLSIAF